MLGVSGLSSRFGPLHAPAPVQAFSGMYAHRSAAAHPIICSLRSVFRSAHMLWYQRKGRTAPQTEKWKPGRGQSQNEQWENERWYH